MKNTKIISLSSGYELLCRPVPPDAFTEIYRTVPEPKLPKVKIESVAGNTEEKYPLPGTDEWTEWQEAQRAWRKKNIELTKDFATNYGIVGWREIGNKKAFDDAIPKSWKLPAIMVEYGVEPAKDTLGRRLQFIRHELIINDTDADAVHKVIAGNTEPLTKEEVTAAMTPFESEITEEGR